MCNDTYTQMGIDLGNQYAITPWAKTNEGKIVIGTSIIVGLLVIAIVAPEVTAAAMSTGAMTSTTAATMIETVTADMAWGSLTTSMMNAEYSCYMACKMEKILRMPLLMHICGVLWKVEPLDYWKVLGRRWL